MKPKYSYQMKVLIGYTSFRSLIQYEQKPKELEWKSRMLKTYLIIDSNSKKAKRSPRFSERLSQKSKTLITPKSKKIAKQI